MIAFFGMGLLGSNFVRAYRRRGEEVRVWNRTLAKAHALEADGATAFADPAEAARGAARIHLTLSDDAAVDDVLERARPGFSPGVSIVDHTTTSPTGTRARAERWSARGVEFQHAPVFMAPQNAREGATKLFFSHVEKGTMYMVSVRFKSGGFTYLVESAGDSASDPIGNGAAGVTVTDANGKTVADIQCIERPTLFAPYMQMALACDLENPHGKAACGKNPLHLPGQAKRKR